MSLAAPLLATAVALGSPTAPTPERAFALLADNRVVAMALPSGRILARVRVGPRPAARLGQGRMLVRADTRLFVLVRTESGEDSIAVLDKRTARVRARWRLEPGVHYRGIVSGGDQLYAYGGRPGTVMDRELFREQSAVVTQIDQANGQITGTTTIRALDGHQWWIYWGAAAPDGFRIALAYHGGTTGADWIDIHGNTLARCELQVSDTRAGCMPEAHGMIEPYGVGWIAATGGEELLQYGRSGNVLSRLHTGIRRDHLMNFTLQPTKNLIYVISSCLYSREGLRRLVLPSGSLKIIRPNICGESVAIGRSALVVMKTNALEIRRLGTARLLRSRDFVPDVLDVLVTP